MKKPNAASVYYFIPYTFICAMIDHYEHLVNTARNDKELEVRLENWFYWESELIKMAN
jgi:hypothetical protein